MATGLPGTPIHENGEKRSPPRRTQFNNLTDGPGKRNVTLSAMHPSEPAGTQPLRLVMKRGDHMPMKPPAAR
jgi:hypothetical protein